MYSLRNLNLFEAKKSCCCDEKSLMVLKEIDRERARDLNVVLFNPTEGLHNANKGNFSKTQLNLVITTICSFLPSWSSAQQSKIS
jgi:hypothetical protein